MTKSKNILSTVFSVSLLVLPLLVVQADGQRAARAEEERTGTTSSPLPVRTIIYYCNNTPHSINTAIGVSYSNWAARNWKTLGSGGCDTITFDKGYKGIMLFYVDASGSRPFRKPVGGGKNCFEYTARNNMLNLSPTFCPNNLEL